MFSPFVTPKMIDIAFRPFLITLDIFHSSFKVWFDVYRPMK